MIANLSKSTDKMRVSLFFTRGMSLDKWLNVGMYDREKLLYEELIINNVVKQFIWFTYGVSDHHIAKKLTRDKRLNPSILVLPMPKIFDSRVGMLIYSIILPIIYSKHIKESTIYKTNQMNGSWTAIISKYLYRKPLIIRTGFNLSLLAMKNKLSSVRVYIYMFYEKLACQYANVVLVTSNKDKAHLIKSNQSNASKIFVRPNYIQTDIFKPIKSVKYEKRLIYVGRLHKEKNLFSLIDAIAKTSFTLDMYGEGHLKNKLIQYAQRKNARVNIKGKVENNRLPEILNKYNYYIITSYFEGMPKTLLEAMSCGLICIGTDVEGVNEILIHNENGFLTSIDANSISHSINNLYNDRHTEDKLRVNARQFILDKCSLEDALEYETKLYHTLCGA
jgi:glycosyltransferase involved in cell wall biosynthesis